MAEEERAKAQESETARFIATVESEIGAEEERRFDTDGIAYTKAAALPLALALALAQP